MANFTIGKGKLSYIFLSLRYMFVKLHNGELQNETNGWIGTQSLCICWPGNLRAIALTSFRK